MIDETEVVRIVGRLGYQARLQSIRYGGDSLVLNNDEDLTRSTSSVMFDSGTSFTYLVPQAYASVLSAVSFAMPFIFGMV